MKENVIQISGEIMIIVDVNVKNVMHVKTIMTRIRLYVLVKMENIS